MRDLGVDAVNASKLSLGMLDKLMRQQAAMPAYNGISFIFGCLFFLLVPLVFFLPTKSMIRALSGSAPER